MTELDRIQQRYRERDASAALTGFWTLRNPVVLHLAQERERLTLALLAEAGIDLSQARLLDLGCGMGGEVANYLRWGARLPNLTGVDLMHHRLVSAQAQSGLAAAQASGAQLPFASAQFDVVCQNVVFSSIVDARLRAEVAAEMRRVQRPGGWLLWYDAERTRGGGDAHFQPVRQAEVLRLFPGVQWRFKRLTTDLGLIRRVHAAFGRSGLLALEATGLFKTHLLGLGRPK